MEMHRDISIEDRFKKLEDKLIEIRKLSLGTLLLAKEIWKDELKQKGEGSELIRAFYECINITPDKRIS